MALGTRAKPFPVLSVFNASQPLASYESVTIMHFARETVHWYDRNFDEHEPRKGMIVSFVAADVLFSPCLGGIYAKQQDSYRAMHSALKAFAPGREHIVPNGDEGHDWPTAPSHTHNGAWAASDVAEKWWTELFLPGK